MQWTTTNHLVPGDVEPGGEQAERDAVAGVVALGDARGPHALLGHVHVRDARGQEHVQHRHLPGVLGARRRRRRQRRVVGVGAVAALGRFERLGGASDDAALQAHGHRVHGLGERQLLIGSLRPGLVVVVFVLDHFTQELHPIHGKRTYARFRMKCFFFGMPLRRR